MVSAENANYQWYKDDQAITDDDHFVGATTATLTINSITSDDEGDYYVEITTNCGDLTSDTAHLTVNVSLVEIGNNTLKVYPNPTSDIVIIEFANNVGNMNLRIVDINGRVVYENVITEKKTLINISKLSSGVYTMTFISTETVATVKLIVK